MIEAYGIEKSEFFNCSGCNRFKEFCEENDIDYIFYDVTKYDDILSSTVLDRDKIVDLAARASFRTLRITYPVIFDDNQLMTLKEFVEKYKE